MCLKNGGKNSVGTFSKKELFIMKQRKIMLKTIEDAKKFVEETGCDTLAIAIGTAHGIYPKDFLPHHSFHFGF